MKKILGTNSIWDLLKHLVIIIIIGVTIVLLFFFVYLPNTTNKGETITVPDASGLELAKMDDFLGSRKLRFEVADSGYSADHAPLAVLKQYPLPGSKVKENRKVYLTVNAITPPLVKIPDLLEKSLRSSERALESVGLKRGEIEYRPDVALNKVLEVIYDGRKITKADIEKGIKIPKGSSIDLVVAGGTGATIQTPDFIGMDFDIAEVKAFGSELVLRIVDAQSDSIPGKILRQNPLSGENIRSGEIVDVWVQWLDSLTLLSRDSIQIVTDPDSIP